MKKYTAKAMMPSTKVVACILLNKFSMQTVQPYPNGNERRRWERIALREGCLIFETEGALGEVLDISEGGIGLQSIYSLPGIGHLPGKGLLFGRGILLENLSYWIASTAVLPKDFEFSTVVKKRYGLLFRNLTDSQKIKLGHILRICRSV
jgi:hypothetical protein